MISARSLLPALGSVAELPQQILRSYVACAPLRRSLKRRAGFKDLLHLSFNRSLALAAALLAAGCTQGPDFTAPPVADSEGNPQINPSTAETGIAGGESQSF